MSFLIGLTVIGLAALWEWRPRWGKAVAGDSVLVFLLVAAPFWGANWGGGIAAAFAMLLFWLLVKPHRYAIAIPVAVGLMVMAALMPGHAGHAHLPLAGDADAHRDGDRHAASRSQGVGLWRR